jgi:hypothetical protein
VTGNKDKGGTIGALAGARALPPLMIVLYHFSEGHHYTGVLWFDRRAAICGSSSSSRCPALFSPTPMATG